MYIRWIVRKHKNSGMANVVFHDAYLVESYRDDHNEPRQRTICYLGNIRQIDDTFPPMERALFLLRAERILDGEPEVAGAEREQIDNLLHQYVPELTADEVETAFHNNLRWYYRWWRDHGAAPTRAKLIELIDTAATRLDPM